MARIRFENVIKRFRVRAPRARGFLRPRSGAAEVEEVRAADGIDLVVEDQELFTFVGPSGCGKSTALNLIAGLETATSGEIWFDDRAVGHLDPKDRDVAMVFQSYALYPHLSVFENVAFPLRVRKLSGARLEESVREVAAALGLEGLLERSPRELSGGQRQRVALARALVRRPAVFLLDEPLSNLDARLRLEMRAEIKRIHERFRITTIYVTHDQEEAMVLSDRVAVMGGGRVQQCAPPLEVFERPANRFVASFVGSPPINFVEADRLVGAPGADRLFVEVAPGDVEAGLRPNDLEVLAPGAARVGALRLAGPVRSIERTGVDTWLDVEWRGQALRARATGQGPLVVGQEVELAIPREKVHLFERESGQRVAAPLP